MTSGLSNSDKAKIRQLTPGKVGRAELLEAESKSYHGAGTCTFYGTANSNQMLMEAMGLHLPGAAFITHAAARCADRGRRQAPPDHRPRHNTRRSAA
jgi:dihydroxyacid dehydratase/phosphogluconate dehydratase